ncbi:class I SAM-dependent methyltransferase [Streptomyces sp. F63]|uniref:class I SAM-dependent methyltransferase n=1 Tax=Streptomyces sp. F63 TaxID=2824887 RepID=UPI001B363859|nr:class I SAM-dependent methyltransferase [Streptomyces sp. F63]MBQ0988319.1 class I SAM-dependent methyltransferase [Streptomyces sp. F63]
MSSDRGPTLRELAVQALSSVERGYDLLAPKFDRTPYRTPGRVLDAVTAALRPLGPFGTGLDLGCGTGAGLGVLRRVCRERVVGADFSAGMLAVARSAVPTVPGGPAVDLVRADVRRLPFAEAFDLAVGFGAFGHFLPEERPALFAGVHAALRPGGVFAFPLPAPPPVGSRPYWALWGFDAAMRVRNALWRPPFVMYYRTFRLADVRRELTGAGFEVGTAPLEGLGRRPDGSPRCRLVVARRCRPGEAARPGRAEGTTRDRRV